MDEDMKRVLEELGQELLEEDLLEDMPQKLKEEKEEDDLDAILARILAENDGDVSIYGESEPAFEDPDKLEIAQEPEVYCNYSNDYGNDAAKEEKAAREAAKTEDKWLIALMGVASALCLGIIGVLIYWMEAFLK